MASSSLLARTSLAGLSRTAPSVLRRSFVFLASRRSPFPHPRRPFPSELLTPRLRLLSTTSPTLAALATATAEASAFLAEEMAVEDTIPDSRIHFDTMRDKIHPNTLKAITVAPFQHTHLSPVQAEILPLLPELALAHDHADANDAEGGSKSRKPRDLLVKAKTGTGKTMAFLIPAIESRLNSISAHVSSTLSALSSTGVEPSAQDKLRAESQFARDNVGTLIISPTRELATQIAVEAQNLTRHHRGFQVQVFLGGESKGKQMRDWKGRKDILVATPGRLLDMLNSEASVRDALKGTRLLVLDEADTLLDMGFREDIERITSYLPQSPQRQTFLFSATVSRAIEQIAQKTLARSHRFVNCVSADDSPVHDHIPQYHTVLPSGEHAFPHLLRLIAHDQLMKQQPGQAGQKSKIVIFFSTTKMVQLFADLLRMSSHSLPLGRQTAIYEMHAKRDMAKRISTSSAFRNSSALSSILVTSDVSARGVDYPGVTRVIQMGLPGSRDMYVHRVGRTGRGGKMDGRGDLVMSQWEMNFLKKKMGDVKMRPVTVAEVGKEVEEMAAAVAASPASAALASMSSPTSSSLHSGVTKSLKSYLPTLSTLPDLALSATSSTPADVLSEAFMAQLGFYLGHMEPLGLRQDEVVEGLGRFFQDMGAMARPPAMSRGMEERLRSGMRRVGGHSGRSRSSGGGGFGGRGGIGSSSGGDRDRVGGYGGQRSARPAWGTFASGQDQRGLGRGERERGAWESGGFGAGGFKSRDRDSNSEEAPRRSFTRSRGGWGDSSAGSSAGAGAGASAGTRSSGYGRAGERSTPGFASRGTRRRDSFEEY